MKVTIDNSKFVFDSLKAGDVFMIQYSDDDPMFFMKTSYRTDTCNAYNLTMNELETFGLDHTVIKVDAELIIRK